MGGLHRKADPTNRSKLLHSIPRCQLTAGGVDVFALAAADIDHHIAAFEVFDEGIAVFVGAVPEA